MDGHENPLRDREGRRVPARLFEFSAQLWHGGDERSGAGGAAAHPPVREPPGWSDCARVRAAEPDRWRPQRPRADRDAVQLEDVALEGHRAGLRERTDPLDRFAEATDSSVGRNLERGVLVRAAEPDAEHYSAAAQLIQ